MPILRACILSQDAAHGALPTLFAAVAGDATAGGYYGPDGFQELKGHPVAAKIAPVRLVLVAVKAVSVVDRLPSSQWHFARFSRPPPVLG